MVDRLLLVGMMGVGKTTIGGRLARILGWDYLDSDAEVMAQTGCTVPELFAEQGEAAFRAAETHALVTALSSLQPVVVSVAGGAVLSEANRKLLTESGKVVWLRADPATLAGRVGDGTGRPLLGGDPAGALVRLDKERRPLYQSIANVVVDVDSLSPSAVVERILAETHFAHRAAKANS